MAFPKGDKIIIKADVAPGDKGPACDFLASRSGLPKGRIKDAMNKGAVRIKRKRGGFNRLRRATATLFPGDRIELYYDEKLLSLKPPEATCIRDLKHYSVWDKPAGLVAQGTEYGDHCSLMRRAELYFAPQREVFLVHRLDREAAGLMLIAHSGDAASKLSALFAGNNIIKKYRVEVLGDLGGKDGSGVIDLPLDGKPSVTEYNVLSYSIESNISTVNAVIRTGRLHQIRRHFDLIGFPVMGDPKYGKGNKNAEGMKLAAVSLKFFCPFQNREMEFTI